jgi:hypothetical protein
LEGIEHKVRELNTGITIDESFVQKRSEYKTAAELFGATDREAVKLLKELEDEKLKNEKLVNFTNHCIHLVKRYRKCRFCKV